MRRSKSKKIKQLLESAYGKKHSLKGEKAACSAPKKTEAEKSERSRGRYDGVKIKVSFSVVVMAAIAIATGHARETLSYLAAVMLHELAHAGVATRLGYTLTALRVMPYGAALTGKFEGARARDEFLIAAAGPLSNVVFAVMFIALWWLVPELFYYTEIYVTANVFTALINLLPVFPLDGGRATLALLSRRFPRNKAYRALRVAGVIVGAAGVALAVAFVRSLNFSYFTFIVFILVSSIFPDKSSRYQRLYGVSYRMERIRAGLPVREMLVHKNSRLLELSRLLNANYFSRFIVTDDKLRTVAGLDETELETLMSKYPPSTTVALALKKDGGDKANNGGA